MPGTECTHPEITDCAFCDEFGCLAVRSRLVPAETIIKNQADQAKSQKPAGRVGGDGVRSLSRSNGDRGVIRHRGN